VSELSLSYEKPREVDLLLHCARTHLDTQHLQHVRTLLRENLDWAYVTQMAIRHGVMPLLYWNLNKACPDSVPANIFQRLRTNFFQISARNLSLAGELLKVLHHLKEHGIPAIPFKGPTLAVSAYGNLSLRQFGDLDIFVPKRHLPRAAEILLSQGYQARNQLNQEHHRDPLEEKYHTFIRKDGLVGVDLQWMIADNHFSFQLDHEDWQARLAPVSLAGGSVLSFPPEVMLLILCVHGSKHRWTRLQWVCDIAELLRAHPRMDWERVLELASRLGAQRMLTLGIVLAHDLLGTTFSAEELKRLRKNEVAESLVRQLRSQLFQDSEGVHDSGEPSAFYLKLRERWWDKTKYAMYLCIKRKPVAKARGSGPLPVSLTCLYYLLWPFLQVGKYGLRTQRIKKTFSEWLESMG
jgi:hypothetical protein